MGSFPAARCGRGPWPSGRYDRVLRACYPLADAADAFTAARRVPGKTWIRLAGD
jgi:hypothetical protein